jgi:hypothetical protein
MVGAASASQRTFTLRNLCSEPVWFGFSGGAVSARNSTSAECHSDSDCWEGTHCIAASPTLSFCFAKNPVPADGNYKLMTGQTNSVTIPISSQNFDIIWSGVTTGKTGCDSTGSNCKTADCGNDGKGGCVSGRGFSQPATQAEYTLSKTSIDFYDVEVINGIHMGVSMSPTNVAGGSNPYSCGSPGAKFPKTATGSCDWNMVPPSDEYYWVSAGGSSCTSTTQCSGSQKCGLSFNPGHDQLLWRTCGSIIGYWSADQVCGISPSYGAPFNCSQSTP